MLNATVLNYITASNVTYCHYPLCSNRYFSIHIIPCKSDAMIFVVLLHETGSNASLTYNYFMIIAVHSPYSSAMPWMQNILSTSVGLWTWIKLKRSTYFWPDIQPENIFHWNLMLSNGNFHVCAVFFLFVFTSHLIFQICLVHAKFSKLF